jgi:hypothetical protein
MRAIVCALLLALTAAFAHATQKRRNQDPARNSRTKYRPREIRHEGRDSGAGAGLFPGLYQSVRDFHYARALHYQRTGVWLPNPF